MTALTPDMVDTATFRHPGLHGVLVLMQLLGSDHVLAGASTDPVYVMNVSRADLDAACELAGLSPDTTTFHNRP